MANITIKELIASDTVSDIVDKINFNFDQLLLNGGGPVGLTGGAGPIGPQGPRGTTWFTTRDLYNTSLTTEGSTGYTFPTWSGTPVLVNNPTQFNGDPNKYLPIATPSSPNTYPFYSFTFGTTGSEPRSGDLFLQESDDTFNGVNSTDGDVWQYNAVANTWSFTGVNIKGETGSTGSSAATEWQRTTDNNLVDEIHPKLETGHDDVVRVLIGTDDSTIITDNPNEYTSNIVTIYQDTGGYNLAFIDDNSTSGISTTDDYAGIKTGNNVIAIEGFSGTSGENTFDVELTARSGSIILKSSDDSLTDITLELDRNGPPGSDPYYPKFLFKAATINVTSELNDFNNNGPVHWLTDGYNTLTIMHNTDTISGSTDYPYNGGVQTYTQWTGNYTRINSIKTDGGANASHLIFQESYTNSNIGNLGIGDFSTGLPTAKLSIGRGKTTEAALSLGDSWSKGTKQVVGTDSYTGYLSNVAFFQTHIVVGATSDVTSYPSVFGGGTSNSAGANSITTDTNINIKSGIIGFNTFFDPGFGLKSMKTDATNNLSQFIGSGDWLYNKGGTSGGVAYTPAASDLFGTIVIGGSSTGSTYNTAFGASNLQTGGLFRFNANLVVKSVSNQVGINTTLLQASLNSYGGAIIGKTKTWSGATGGYHQDFQSNNNIIIGHPLYSSFIKLNLAAVGQKNATWLTTPVWSASMRFNDGGGGYNQDVASYNSFTANVAVGVYKDYLPSNSSQFKIIHGKNYRNSSVNQLLAVNNPYDTGIGLEIENRVLTAIGSGPYQRTPIIKDASGSPIIGHRPLIVTKRPVYSDSAKYHDFDTFTIFEISPINNVSVGQSIKLPSKSVWKVIQKDSSNNIASPAPTGTVTYPDGTEIALNAGNASTWWDFYPGGYTSIILPEYNKSLHISSIFPSGSTSDQFATDQFISKIDAGIVIDTGVIGLGFVTPSHNWLTYNEYSTHLKRSSNNYSITSSIAFSNIGSVSGGESPNLFSNKPLGIKPGLTIFAPNVNALVSVPPVSHLKGGDLLLAGGDVLYSLTPQRTQSSLRTLRAGDVYITGGHLYKNKVDEFDDDPEDSGTEGAVLALTDVNNLTTAKVNRKVHGNIYLGSITGDSFGNNFDYVRRTGSIYAGYDSSGPAGGVGIWNQDADGGAPIGNATFNVSGFSDVPNDIQGAYDERNGKAINIQYGDIVTKNQNAGWIEVNLKNEPGTFKILDKSGIIGITSDVPAESLYPVAKLYYKVIGYTVFWKLTAHGIKFTSNAGNNVYRNEISFKLPSSLPVPKNYPIVVENSSTGVYRSTNVANNNGSVASTYNTSGLGRDANYNFSGHGHVILRNGSDGFPTRGTILPEYAQIPAYSASFNASFNQDGGFNTIKIYQCGPKLIHNVYADFKSPGNFNDYIIGISNAQNYELGALGFGGFFPESINTASSSGKLWWSSTGYYTINNRVYYVDISMSGQYELDPDQWF